MDAASVFAGLDLDLWQEACWFADNTRDRVTEMRSTGVWPRGAGDYRILYFLVRHVRPEVVIETGVAFGFSSRAVLMAFRKNGSGHLYSSDLPYPRLKNANDLIGSFVEHELRDEAWTLNISGDRDALPRFASVLAPGAVDLLHYDSDKSAGGRSFAVKTLATVLAPDALLVIDDINDNLWFRDFVEETGRPFYVLRFVEDWPKYIGVIGL